MLKYLVVLLWPLGIAAILGGTYILVRRSGDAASGVLPALPAPRDGGRRHGHRGAGTSALRGSTLASGQLVLVATVGTLVAVGITSLLGLLVVYHGLTIDRPIFNWIQTHQVHLMTALMNRFTKIGDTWTTWGAAATAAVCLAATFRDKRWLPPVALAFAIFADHYATLALRHEFHRLGPPTSPLGTYPSGGVDRTVFLLGLIAYLLWRGFSGRRTTGIWTIGVVAALTFNEVYSRIYLSKHWTTDAFSGVLYGGLLLAAFIIAIRGVAGRPVQPVAGRPAEGARAGLPAEDPVT